MKKQTVSTQATLKPQHKENTLKHSKVKLQLSREAEAFLNFIVLGAWTQREDGKIDVSGDVDAYHNKDLPLFMGKEIFFGSVTKDFDCTATNITSLEGAPEKVGENFYCLNNATLTSLKGAPKEVGGDFDFRKTRVTSRRGIGEVGGRIYSDLR